AAVSGEDFAGARELAEFRRRVDAAWPRVRVLRVEGSGLPDIPVIGAQLSLRAHIDLAGLATDEVTVQVVLGRVGADDELTDPVVVEMNHAATESGTELFAVTTPLPHAGAVGYTVRVLPRHRLLSGTAELGLVATASP
ncbi:MAG: DUF3417 domain-containing protein, partial [Nocardia sp.]|nr:DUF3417 domain-containing protein [Nocardia sp.]